MAYSLKYFFFYSYSSCFSYIKRRFSNNLVAGDTVSIYGFVTWLTGGNFDVAELVDFLRAPLSAEFESFLSIYLIFYFKLRLYN